jgi:hypothetical protein
MKRHIPTVERAMDKLIISRELILSQVLLFEEFDVVLMHTLERENENSVVKPRVSS